MLRAILLCSLLLIWPVRADTIHVYCDDWPGFCQADGHGVYLDIVRAIYKPAGYGIHPHIVPYKRALAVVAQKGGDMAMGVYQEEVDGVHQPRFPASADDVTVLMKTKWLPDWEGEQSLRDQDVLWLRGWAFDKFISEPMRWYEIDSHAMALQLLAKGRYRYYLTAGVLYPKADIPPDMTRVFLRWVPTYPIFADNEKGRQLARLWGPGMQSLIKTGALMDIYRRNQLYEYYRDFLKAQTQSLNK